VLLVERGAHRGRAKELAASVQANLERLNEEYAAKTSSGRLLPLEVREVPVGAWHKLRHEKTYRRGNFEQYKHPCFVNDLEFVERIAGSRPAAAFSPHFAGLPWRAGALHGSTSESTPAS
jgi:hypothetical protein